MAERREQPSPSGGQAHGHRALRLVVFCFFLSGFTGLIGEILRTRMVAHLVGSGPFAASIVLTVFMGGLGLGGYLAGRWVDRVSPAGRLLTIYAVLEMSTGFYLALPWLLEWAMPLDAVLYHRLFSQFLFFQVLTFSTCALLLGAPVICMGATLPVLGRFCVNQFSRIGRRVGVRYGLNTLGAALGGFWLMCALGLRGSLFAASSLNLLIGAVCVAWASGITAGEVLPYPIDRLDVVDVNPQMVAATSEDYLLVGIRGPRNLALADALANRTYAQHSRNVTLLSPMALCGLIVTEDLRTLAGPGPWHTDDRPLLEAAAPRHMCHTSTAIRKTIRSRQWLRPETQSCLREVNADVDTQIDFAAYALSVCRPFFQMVDPAKASPSQRERFEGLPKVYSAQNPIRLEEAIQHFQHALDIGPESATIRNELGIARTQLGRYNEAAAHFTAILRRKPNSVNAHANLGIVLFRLGRFGEAVAHHRRALALQPEVAEIHDNLGLALRKQGNVQEAIVHFRRALQLRPDFPEAQRNLSEALDPAKPRSGHDRLPERTSP